MTQITMNNKIFNMTESEWEQAKSLILNRKQEQAMHWWANAFGITFVESVWIVNRIQCVLQYGSEEQKHQMVS